MAPRKRSTVGHWLPRLQEIGSSYWFVPGVMAVGAVGLSFLTMYLDRTSIPFGESTLFYSGSGAGARSVLETIATSMITVAGVVFSITTVALSLASRQFGPKLLRNFMENRPNQVVFGTFVATFLYCVLVMRNIREDFLPHLSTTVGVVLAIASLGVLIFFIHHITRSIRIDGLLARVAADLDSALDHLHSERIGEPPPPKAEPRLPDDFARRAGVVRAPKDGYVASFDAEQILEAARERDLIVELLVRPQDFVIEDMPVYRVYPAERCGPEVMDELRDALLLGRERTTMRDARYGIDQLVQLALRALSPALNDPMSAMDAIDRLAAATARLARHGAPSAMRHDRHGRLRVVTRAVTLEEVITAGWDPLVRNAAEHAQPTRHLLESIEKIEWSLDRPDDRRLFHDLVARLGQACPSAMGATQWGRLEETYRRVLGGLAGPQGRTAYITARKPSTIARVGSAASSR